MKYKKIISYVLSMAMLLPIVSIGNIASNDNAMVISAETPKAEKVATTLMDNYSSWSELLSWEDGFKGVTFLDVDLDGELELVVANQQGTIRDTYTQIYKVDTSSNKVTLMTDATSDYYIDDTHYSMDLLQYDVKLYTTITDLGEAYIKGQTFYLSTDCIYGDKQNMELATIQLVGDSDGVHQYAVFNSKTDNGVTSHYQSAFAMPNDMWVQDDGNETSYYDGLKDLNLNYSIVGKDGSITKDDLINSYNSFSYDGFSNNDDSDNQDVVDTSNKCGDNATWSLSKDGTLTISGTGAMYDYDNIHFSTDEKSSPWLKAIHNISDITSIVIEDGITSIGECAFYDLSFIQSVKLPNTLESIGKDAFRIFSSNDCKDIFKTITIPSSVKTIGDNALGYYDTSYTDENGDLQYKDGLLYDLTIKGYTGSQAETYAKKNGIKFVALDNPSSDVPPLHDGDIITLTGTVKSEDYEINSENKGTVIILDLDTPITYAFYGNPTGSFTDGQEVVVKSVQLSSMDNSYIGKNITVEGKVMYGHTAHHIRDIVLEDCDIIKVNDDDAGKTITTTTKPVVTTTKPIVDTTKPIVDTTKPIVDTTKPKSTTTKPTENTTGDTSDKGVLPILLVSALAGITMIVTKKYR